MKNYSTCLSLPESHKKQQRFGNGKNRTAKLDKNCDCYAQEVHGVLKIFEFKIILYILGHF